MVTIKTPKKRLNPTFRFGFFISPAMKVTLFQASLEKMEPTMAETIPAKMAAPNVGIADSVAMSQRIVRQASDQLVSHISELKPKVKPTTINPTRDNILTNVKRVCVIFPLLILLLFNQDKKTIVEIARTWAADS